MGQCEGLCSQDGQRTAPTPFLYTKKTDQVRNVEISTGNPNVIRKMENELIEFGLVAKRKSGAMGDYVDFDGKGITASSGPLSIVIGCFHKN